MLGFGQKRVAGFSAGKTIHYYDLGPVKVAPGNDVLPLVAISNGVAGQHNITEETIAPGATDYPPLWGIVNGTWTSSAHKRLLTSYAQVMRAEKAGRVEAREDRRSSSTAPSSPDGRADRGRPDPPPGRPRSNRKPLIERKPNVPYRTRA